MDVPRKPFRVAIHARTSTSDKGQDIGLQTDVLTGLVAWRDWRAIEVCKNDVLIGLQTPHLGLDAGRYPGRSASRTTSPATSDVVHRRDQCLHTRPATWSSVYSLSEGISAIAASGIITSKWTGTTLEGEAWTAGGDRAQLAESASAVSCVGSCSTPS